MKSLKNFFQANDLLITSAILLLALLLMLPHLTSSIWGDEFITYREAVLGEPVALTGKPASVLDIQLTLAKLGDTLVGQAWGIRLPSILFGLGTILLIGLLANDLYGREVKYIAMLLATFSPILIEFSGEGRPYTALAFWGIAFIYTLRKFYLKETIGNSSALAIISILGLLTRLTFLGQLAVGGLLYLVKRRRVSMYALGIILVVLPFIIRAAYESVAYESISTTLGETGESVSVINFIVRAIFSFTFGYNTFLVPDLPKTRNIPISTLVNDNILIFSLIFIVALGLLAGLILTLKKHPVKTLILLAFIIIPSALMILVAQTGYTVIREKFLITMLGIYLILIAAMFKELLRFKIGYLIVGMFVFVIGVSFYNYYAHSDTHGRKMFISELNEQLLSDFRQGDVLVSYETLSREPNYYSILKNGVVPTIVYDNHSSNQEFTALSEKLLDSAENHVIYLVDDTTSRHLRDSEGILIENLKSARSWTRQKYGRNYSLYVFK